MIRNWVCPACKKTDQTNDKGVGTRFHVCPKMRFLSTPMVLAGVSAKLVLNEREDYVGTEAVRLDPEKRRPVMNLQTVRDNGTDTIVYAPTARGEGRA
jgi:hypothetical protein